MPTEEEREYTSQEGTCNFCGKKKQNLHYHEETKSWRCWACIVLWIWANKDTWKGEGRWR
jgi:hypothetical protein